MERTMEGRERNLEKELPEYLQRRGRAALRTCKEALDEVLRPRLTAFIRRKLEEAQTTVDSYARAEAGVAEADLDAWCRDSNVIRAEAGVAEADLDAWCRDSNDKYKAVVTELFSLDLDRWSFVPQIGAARSEYFAQPRWRRLAVVLTNFPHPATKHFDHWDDTALCAVAQSLSRLDAGSPGSLTAVENDLLWKASHGGHLRSVRDVRNALSHNALSVSFHEMTDVIEEALGKVLGGVDSDWNSLRTKILKESPAAKHSWEAVQQADDDVNPEKSRLGLKILTAEQKRIFDILRSKKVGAGGESSGPARFLIDSPGGSGKTVIAIKLVAAHAIDIGRAAAAVPNDTLRQQLCASTTALLLCHSARLVEHVLVPGICDELNLDAKNDVEWLRLDDGMVRVRPRGGGCAIVVSSVNALCRAVAGEAAQSEADVRDAMMVESSRGDASLSFEFAVIDEGHHVFSSREPGSVASPEFTQTRFRDARRVRQVLEHCLVQPQHRLVVFHDDSHQHDLNIRPAYPEQCETPVGLATLLRLPGRVRDLAASYCHELEMPPDDGRVPYFPVVDERIEGEEVTYFDVDVVAPGSNLARFRDTDKPLDADRDYLSEFLLNFPEMAGAEIKAHDIGYAAALGRCLDALAEKYGSFCGRRVAVLMPQTDLTWMQRIIDMTCGRVEDSEVRSALTTTTAGSYSATGLFWGPVEGFVGQERPLTIVAGFRHAQYLLERHERAQLSLEREIISRVDSLLHQAITRATFGVRVVEVQAASFAEHVMFNRLSTVTASGTDLFEAVPSSTSESATGADGSRIYRRQADPIRVKNGAELPCVLGSVTVRLGSVPETVLAQIPLAAGVRVVGALSLDDWERLPILQSLAIVYCLWI